MSTKGALLTVRQVADRLNVPASRVYAFMAAGQLAWVNLAVRVEAVQPGRRCNRKPAIYEADLEAFLEARTREAVSRPAPLVEMAQPGRLPVRVRAEKGRYIQ